MARRKPAKRSKADKPTRPSSTSEADAIVPSVLSIDYRMGLVLFGLLELGTYAILAAADPPWFSRPETAIWRNVLLAVSVVIWLMVAGPVAGGVAVRAVRLDDAAVHLLAGRRGRTRRGLLPADASVHADAPDHPCSPVGRRVHGSRGGSRAAKGSGVRRP